MSAIAYHIIVYPLSLLPLGVIYLISDFFYLLLISVFPYRKEVIVRNIQNSFPDYTPQQIKQLRRSFYRHFADLLAEGIKNLSIREKELRNRLRVSNPELLDELYEEKRNVLLVSGHYNNWEWLISAQNFLFKHQAVGIGTPLSNRFWNKKVNERRARFGMRIIHAKDVKSFFSQSHEQAIATLILSDQAPGDARKAYWMNFLNQETPVLFGCEQLAHAYDQAVVFFHTSKVKRGHYEIELKLICRDASQMNWGEITEQHTRLLEEVIVDQPSYWVWSHKRWKRPRPDDLETLKTEQKNKFNEKYKHAKTS